MLQEVRKCWKCGIAQPLDQFNDETKLNKRTDCKGCQKEYSRLYYIKNREKVLAQQVANRVKYPKVRAAVSRKYYLAKKAKQLKTSEEKLREVEATLSKVDKSVETLSSSTPQ